MNLGLVCERQEAHGQLIINSSWLIGMGQKKLSDLVLHSFTGSQVAKGEARPMKLFLPIPSKNYEHSNVVVVLSQAFFKSNY